MFTIDKIKINDHEYVVCSATDYINPFSLLNDVKTRLIELGYNSNIEILFDLFPTNRNSENRFVKINFDGNEFLRNGFSVVNPDMLDKQLLEIQNEKMKSF